MSSTTTTSPHQLSLLAENLKLSVLERQRSLALNLDATKQDAQITRALNSLQEGLEQLETTTTTTDDTSELNRIRTQFEELYSQFYGSPAPPPPARPEADTTTTPETTSTPRRSSKNVRFRDNPADEAPDAEDEANRSALFAERYQDEPDGPPDQSQMDNVQIHTYHTQTLRDQDDQLDTLGQSIGRQRMLGIEMGNELDEQNALLTDVEGGVDRHSSTLERARRNLGQVARKSRDNWNWLTIGILIVVLVLLIIVLK